MTTIRTSIEDLLNKIKQAHGDQITIDLTTFTGMGNKARFIDKDLGEWWAIPSRIVMGRGHPSRKHLTPEIIERKIRELHGDDITIDMSTYSTSLEKARFIDKDYGEFYANVSKVINSGTHHPKRAEQIRIEKIRKSHKREEFRNDMSNKIKDVYDGIKQTNLEKYGVEHTFQRPELIESNKNRGISDSTRKSISKANKMKLDKVHEKIAAVYGDKVKLIGEYTGIKDKTLFLYKDYGEFTMSLMHVLRGQGHKSRVQDNRIKTNQERYGCNHPNANQDVKDKAKRTCLEKYGVENYTQTKECKNRMIEKGKKKLLPWGQTRDDFLSELNLHFSKGTIYKWIRETDIVDKDKMVEYLSNIGSNFVSENKCRDIIERVTGCSFPKKRVKLVAQFEFDGYCEELKLAFEFDGYQHFRKAWYDSDESFSKRQERDQLRDKQCQDFGIYLIRSPCSEEDLETYITSKVKEWQELKVKPQ